MVAKGSYLLRANFPLRRLRGLTAEAMCGKNLAPRCPAPPFPFPTRVRPREGHRNRSTARAYRSRGDRDCDSRRTRPAQRRTHCALCLAGWSRRLRSAREKRGLPTTRGARGLPGKAQVEIVERVGMLLAQRIAL